LAGCAIFFVQARRRSLTASPNPHNISPAVPGSGDDVAALNWNVPASD
jgi:hypothetical protein